MPKAKLDPSGIPLVNITFKLPLSLYDRFAALQFSSGRSHLLRQLLEVWVLEEEAVRGIKSPATELRIEVLPGGD